jgi:DNA polymerase-1
MENTPSKKLLIIDGNAIIHRAFHAIPNLTTSTGTPTNAIYGFASMILNLLIKEKPEYIVITYDRKGKTFRDDLYTEYKATRVKAPQELYDQIPAIKNLMAAFNIPQFECEGYEADDVIATIAHLTQKNDLHCEIVTGDRDAFQLISERVSVLTPKNGFKEYEIYTPLKVREEFGISPEQFRDYKTLRGDTSDNIPGVPGIGEKTAANLLRKFDSIEKLYTALGNNPSAPLPEGITAATARKLTDGRASMEMSAKLVALRTDAPIEFDIEKCKTHTFDLTSITRLFENYEFRSLIKKLDELKNCYSEIRQSEVNCMLPLEF